MKIDTEQAVRLIEEHQEFIILTHCNPDGDTLGCGYALMRALKKQGKKVKTVNADTIGSDFSYLIRPNDEVSENAFVIAVDTADIKLLGSVKEEYEGRIQLCIDHHGSNRLFAKHTLLDSTAAAACEIMYDVIKKMGVTVDEDIATCLYTGISTDTGCFRYSNVTSRTHFIAGELIALGADHGEVDRVMFETKSKEYFALERLCLEKMKILFDGKVAMICINRKMFLESGADESCTDAIKAIPRQVKGAVIGVTLREKDDGTFKISVRTHAPYDASEICRQFGGGGHERAAGCEIAENEEKSIELFTEAIKKYLN